MATLAKGYTFGSTEQVTSAKLHSLVDSASISGIVNVDIDASAAIATSKLADIDGSKLTGLANIVSGAGIIPTANIAASSLAALYPVGCIYFSTVDTNPASLFGFGTWVAFGKGQVLVGKADSGTFVTAGSTGGEETHTLIADEMPIHAHTTQLYQGSSGPDNRTSGTDSGSSLQGTATSATAGTGGAHNNLQPYRVVYIFNRTA